MEALKNDRTVSVHHLSFLSQCAPNAVRLLTMLRSKRTQRRHRENANGDYYSISVLLLVSKAINKFENLSHYYVCTLRGARGHPGLDVNTVLWLRGARHKAKLYKI